MGDQPATGTPSGESASRGQAPAHATRIDAVLRELSELRGRARRVLVLSAVLTGLAAVLLSLIGLGLVDFMLRLPWPVRFLALLGVLALGVWWYRTRVGPALRFRPTLTELALRVEARRPAGAEGTQTNALRHLLASGVDLAAEGDEGDDDDRAARRRVLEALTRRWRRGATLNAVASKPAWTGSARAGGVVGLLLVLLVVAPTLVGIGAVRVLVPFAGAEWPKRQVVADVTGLQAHASDTALPLRAAVLRTNRGAGRTPVQAEWRVIVDGEASPWTRVALTGQGRWVTDAGSPAPRGSGGAGELYERLLDPAGFGRGEATQPGRVDARERLVEYRVITDDDATATQRVRLVDPPAVLAAEVNITPPGYASGLLGGDFARGDRELDPAEDGSVVIGPVLAGSRVRLLVMLNKAVGGAQGGDGLGRIREQLPPSAAVEAEGNKVTVSWEAAEPTRLVLAFTDAQGLTSREEMVVSVDVSPDAPPLAVVTQPAFDDAVLPTAVVSIAGEASDDVSLSFARLERSVTRGAPSSSDARASWTTAAEAAWGEADTEAGPWRSARVTATLDLAEFSLSPGDEVLLSVLAADVLYAASTSVAAGDGASDPADAAGRTRSIVRRLRIISSDELIDQVRSGLEGVRRAVQRLDEQQVGIRRAFDAAAEAAREEDNPREATEARAAGERRQSRSQASLTDRIESQREAVERLGERVRQNGLSDESIERLLRESGAALGQAAAASSEAAESARAPDDPQQEPEAQREARQQSTDREQRRVREQLGRVAGLLDRGEDAWAARQQIERLLDEQRDLLERTQDAAADTVGRDAQDLTEEERDRLADLSRRQREAAEQAERTLDELRERRNDTAESRALEEAAREASRAGLSEAMRDAAEQIERNQTQQAQDEQQRAVEALERVLEQADEAERNTDAQLRRTLASLMQQLQALIAQQQRELGRLERAMAENDLSGLDGGMIALNQQTLAVRDEAASAGSPETGAVAGLIDDAARAQARAVSALRSSPPDAASADRAERESLRLLEQALARAQEADERAEQRERQRQVDELKKAYTEALDAQRGLIERASPFAQAEQIDRRARRDLREIAGDQEALGGRIAGIGEQAQASADASVFRLAHRQMERASGSAALRLRSGDGVPRGVSEQQRVADLLAAVIAALDDAQQQNADDQQFQQAGGQQGGQQGGEQGGEQQEQPLIPPIAELRLLRSLQQSAATLTRDLDDRRNAGQGVAREDLDLIGDLQQDLSLRAAELLERVLEQAQGGAAAGSEDNLR